MMIADVRRAFADPAGDVEIDFVAETRKKTLSSTGEAVLIEVKSAKRWQPDFERHMRALRSNANFKVRACIGVYLGDIRLSRQGVEVYPLRDFVTALYEGEIF